MSDLLEVASQEKCSLNSISVVFVSSDSANSHPSRSPVYTGPSTALQCGGPQPGAGRHVHLPATAPPAQGNCHLHTAYTHGTIVALLTKSMMWLTLNVLSAPWGSRWSPGSSPSTELQQWISEWPRHHTPVLILLLTQLPSHLHLHLPTQLWRCTSRSAPRLASK